MKMKKTFYTESAYIFGILALALGAALMTTADFGLSMVIAPAYLLHLKLSQYFPFITFGVAEYMLQALLLLAIIVILHRFRIAYLMSFVTAVLYGYILDGFLFLLSFVGTPDILLRVAFYLAGLFSTALGVAFVFRTYLPPEAYELFVKEMSSKFHLNINRFKLLYDISSCLISVVMAFCFFRLWHFEGIKLGTFICAAVNGKLIEYIGMFLDKRFDFCDRLQLRKKLWQQ